MPFEFTRKRSETKSANPIVTNTINPLKFPDWKIASLLFLKSTRVENAKSRTKRAITALAAVTC